ncbi:Mlp family lipoprotein (plasmid) [Borrelia miyamotoi]|uniref:Mlp family lipoprotein n=2 Tax=Borrelia miyamotoi TaxID=47466 RepID=A0AAQ3HFS8_9SPIR|nr:Mlp family lipoprotein [Borrelia miyamotoi]AHH05866.1 Congo red-binding lipoprotein nlph [Borrelia miyamotoi FR64b]ATQ15570.1 Mlp family lipoprotein [Borrelia miyamotoi]ATQ16591.1 Mlp family lipoprotein [Borrelia miyamotoi]ATQ17764.1 Mlp family lipoprotein [Borrelia miyamotoi]ATQ18984.1 Mlp family lipoprotein [Borrelia miyamotoi]
MIRYINYLIILCGTLLLYCCGERNTTSEGNKPTNGSNTIQASGLNTNRKITLTNDEQQKIDTLIYAFKKIIENDHQLNMEQKEKYKMFEIWLLKDTQKQKELADHFQYVYYVLDQKTKPQQASNIPTKQIIVNTIDCVASNQCDGRNDVYSYHRDDSMTDGEKTFYFFRDLLHNILDKLKKSNNNINTYEEVFKYLRSEFVSPNNAIIDGLSNDKELNKMRFNNHQIKAINFLQESISMGRDLNNPIYISFIVLSNSTVKPALDYIYNELLKCNENQQSINDFNNALQNYFISLDPNEINDETMKQLPNKVTIKCGNAN